MVSGMLFACAVGPAGFRGFSVAFLLLLAMAGCDFTAVNVKARAGEAAELPCTCPADQDPLLVWQKDVNGTQLVVNYDKSNNNEEIAADFQNRTELKRSGDACFLMFYSVRPSDEGWYKCYYMKSPLKHNNIYLEVTDPSPIKSPGDVQSTAVMSSACVLLIILIAVAIFLGIICRKRHCMKRTSVATSTRSI